MRRISCPARAPSGDPLFLASAGSSCRLKCLHLYKYYLHPRFGFMSARIQTWFPFNLQICLNGRHWLMQQLNLLTTALFAARDASIKQLLTQAA